MKDDLQGLNVLYIDEDWEYALYNEEGVVKVENSTPINCFTSTFSLVRKQLVVHNWDWNICYKFFTIMVAHYIQVMHCYNLNDIW